MASARAATARLEKNFLQVSGVRGTRGLKRKRLIDQVATSGGNVVLADTAGKPAAVVMSLQRYEQLLDELNTLRRRAADNA
ncbi:hypothetical protein D2E92_24000 [Mycobacteroides abscessus]|nr:hypothetical protein D2E92_24000 [Mycobacteroides abscessus]